MTGGSVMTGTIPGTQFWAQFETSPPDPTCCVYVGINGEKKARRTVELSEAERDALRVELFEGRRGPICDRLVAAMEAA